MNIATSVSKEEPKQKIYDPASYASSVESIMDHLELLTYTVRSLHSRMNANEAAMRNTLKLALSSHGKDKIPPVAAESRSIHFEDSFVSDSNDGTLGDIE